MGAASMAQGLQQGGLAGAQGMASSAAMGAAGGYMGENPALGGMAGSMGDPMAGPGGFQAPDMSAATQQQMQALEQQNESAQLNAQIATSQYQYARNEALLQQMRQSG